MSIAVIRGRDTLAFGGWGQADLENEVMATARTVYEIGSVTKQFTAAAILKLQEDGKLEVTDKLTKFIPDYPRGDEVTLHHLLTHTSGITSYTSKPNFLVRFHEPLRATNSTFLYSAGNMLPV